MAASTPERWRWQRMLQFRLRSLLLLTLLTAILLTLYRVCVEPRRRQQQAVAALAKKGVAFRFRPMEPRALRLALRLLADESVLTDCDIVQARDCELTDADLAALHDMPYIERLYLERNPITDEGMKHLAALRHLQRLSLWRTEISDEGLRPLGQLSELRVLDIHDPDWYARREGRWNSAVLNAGEVVPGRSALTSRGLEHLKNLKNLRVLHCSFPLDDAGLEALARLPVLRSELVRIENVTDRGLTFLGALRSVREVWSEGGQITGDGLRHLARLGGLQRVRLAHMEATPAAWQRLALPASLEELSLEGASIGDETVAIIGRIGRLQALSLRGTQVTDQGVAQLKPLRQLVELDLRDAPLTGKCLEHVQSLTALRQLALDDPLDDGAVARLGQLSHLNVLLCSDDDALLPCYLTHAGMLQLTRVRGRLRLELRDPATGRGCVGVDVPADASPISDAGIAQLWNSNAPAGRFEIRSQAVTLRSLPWDLPSLPLTSLRLDQGLFVGGPYVVPFREQKHFVSLTFGPCGGPESLRMHIRCVASSQEFTFTRSESHPNLELVRHIPNVINLTIDSDGRGQGRIAIDWDELRHLSALVYFRSVVEDENDPVVCLDATAIERLAMMTTLRELRCQLTDGLRPADLAPLGHLENLNVLELHLDQWSAEHGRFLRRLTNLHEFTLMIPPGPWDDCNWLAELRGLPQLEQVFLHHILPDGQIRYSPPLSPPFQ